MFNSRKDSKMKEVPRIWVEIERKKYESGEEYFRPVLMIEHQEAGGKYIRRTPFNYHSTSSCKAREYATDFAKQLGCETRFH